MACFLRWGEIRWRDPKILYQLVLVKLMMLMMLMLMLMMMNSIRQLQKLCVQVTSCWEFVAMYIHPYKRNLLQRLIL